ncbi:hypothetical protein P0D80_50625, partial [Paraburkholderia sp. RL17-373-BIF-A]
NGVPGLTPDRISLVMQRTEFRYQPKVPAATPTVIAPEVLFAAGSALFLVLLVAFALILLRRRRNTT